MDKRYPILEFDHCRKALINPKPYPDTPDRLPDRAVLCFFHDVIADLVSKGELREVHHFHSEMGKHPVYATTTAEKWTAVIQPGIGAPLAAGFLEELIGHGMSRFVACGGCGVLDGAIARGHIVVPTAAVRDEGTSYHYVAPSREVAPTEPALAAIRSALKTHGVPYITGKTWTTDAFYRETSAKIAQRRADGCVTVEMEAAALFAVAQFRGVELGQILYGGDDCSGQVWDNRDWHKDDDTRHKLFWLAIEACGAL